MAYDGDTVINKALPKVNFAQTHVVIVTGITPCGHVLLNVGGRDGWYFHFTNIYGYPKFMGKGGYSRYLRENDKTEKGRIPVVVSNPEAASARLAEVMAEKWFWNGGTVSCVTFVDEILRAGGAGVAGQCPRAELAVTDFPTPSWP